MKAVHMTALSKYILPDQTVITAASLKNTTAWLKESLIPMYET